MSMRLSLLLALPVAVLLAGCVGMPEGPSVMVLPGSGKSFDQFRADEAACRYYAEQSIGMHRADDAAVDAGVRSAALGTLLGAAAGAAIGGSRGAGVGAGVGLALGGASGVAAADATRYGSQRRYDQSFVQCMYAQGHKVPAGRGTYTAHSHEQPAAPATQGYAPPAGRPADLPPPPPGNPPPPPPR